MNTQAKFLGTLSFIVIFLAGFAFYKTQNEPREPDLEIVTEEGEISYLSPIRFSGHTYSNTTNNSTSFNGVNFIYQNGTFTSSKDLSYFREADFHYHPAINQLISHNRSFMRGKAHHSNQFVETLYHVIYIGNEQDVSFDEQPDDKVTISILNKETEAEQTFEVNLNNSELPRAFYDIAGLYARYPDNILSPEITFFVNQYETETNQEDTLIYSFDMEGSGEDLDPVLSLRDTLTDTGNIHISQTATHNNRYIALEVGENTILSENGYPFESPIPETSNHFIYDVQSTEITPIPELDGERRLVLTENETVYVGNDTGETLDLYRMNMDTRELESVGPLDINISEVIYDDYSQGFNSRISLIDNRLYLVGETISGAEERNVPTFDVIDLSTLETLFSGYLNATDANPQNHYNTLIYDYSANEIYN